jgi:hypothetical protein
MLDFLFELGQLLSLLGLAAGLLLTIRYRRWDHQALPAETRMTESNLVALRSQSDPLPLSLTASNAEPGHRDALVA